MPSVLRANTEPLPEAPPCSADPYRVLPDKIKADDGIPPSLLVKSLSIVKLYRVEKVWAKTEPVV